MAFNPADLRRFPASSLIALAAIALSLLWWSAFDIKGPPTTGFTALLVGDGTSVLHHPWTLLTAIFVHGSVPHLVMNLLAWWYIARRIELVWGPAKLLAAIVFLALFSNIAQVTFSQEGIGISGVIFGLYALAYVLQRKDPRFAGAVSRQSAMTITIWFFVCIVLTYTRVMNIGNVAHGAGAIGGALLGYIINLRNKTLPESAR